MAEKKPTIGIDYGGVCSWHEHENDDFTEEVGINIPNCLETLYKLKEEGYQLILISFCGNKRAVLTRKYFYKMDNPFDEMYFVRKRRYKNDVCKRVGVDVMIDDRLDILETLEYAKSIHFKGHESDNFCKFNPDFHVNSWNEVYDIVKEIESTQEPDYLIDIQTMLCCEK